MAAPAPHGTASDGIKVRSLSPADSIPELTRLLHRAYARLATMGLRYMGLTQHRCYQPQGKNGHLRSDALEQVLA